MNQPRCEGMLTKWNAERGFGFIVASDDGRDIFVHTTAFPDDGYLPTVGEVLTYEVEPDRSGKRSAVRVRRFIDSASDVGRAGGRVKKFRLSKSSAGHSLSSRGQKAIVVVLLATLVVFAYSRYAKRVGQTQKIRSHVFTKGACAIPELCRPEWQLTTAIAAT
jgi:cold shock CspA family protein